MGHLNTTRPLFPKRRLQRPVSVVFVVQWIALTGFFALFCLPVAPLWGLQGWLVAAPVLGVVHWVLWKHLAVCSPRTPPPPFCGLGAANMITMARGWLISVLAGSALVAAAKPDPADWIIWLPALLYLAIGCGDFCDGLVARLTRTESLLGKRLDMSMDALGLLVASAAAVFLERLPPAFLLVGLSYYLFQLGLAYRRFRGKILRSMADRPFGRAMAGIHMGFVALALLPGLSATLLKHAAILFMVPLLLGFVWDWLVVTGRLGDETAHRWRLLFARSGTIVAAAARLVILLAGFHAWQAVFAVRPSGAVVWVVLWCMMVSGWLGRSAAMAGAVIAATLLRTATPVALQVLVFDCMVVLIITGTGRGSLWRPEDILFRTKIGANGTPTGHSSSEGARTAASLLHLRWIRRRPLSGLFLIVAAILYWSAFRNFSLSRALSPLLHWHIEHLAVLFILNAAIIWAMSLRWKLILRSSGHPIGIHRLAAYRIGANAISYLTPGPQFGGEPFQVDMLIRRHNTVAQDATASVAADRLIEFCINGIVLLVGLIVLLQARLLAASATIDAIAGITILILLTGSILSALAIGKTPLSHWLEALCKRVGHRPGFACARTWLQTAERRTGEMLRQPPRVILLYIAASLAQWAFMIGEFWLIYFVCGLPLSLTPLIGVVLAARLAFLLPLPGALGTLESSQVLMLGTLALDPTIGLTVCLIMRARDLLLVGMGAGLVWSWLRVRPKTPSRSFQDPV
jgi:CDP-diacylglycerol--glycerol-3-phosphate 3-phosphatidyltransferase